MRELTDDLMETVARELSVLPPVREEAIERILELAAQQRDAGPAAQAARIEPPQHGAWRARQRAWAGAGLAAALAALLWVGVARRSAPPEARLVDPAGPAGTAGEAASPVPGAVVVADLTAADDALRAVQFVLDAPGVRAVAVVGGFNDWDPAATRLERVPGTTVWTTTVLLPPGRYTYAFIVDDSTWVLDPRAPRAEDPDYGVQSSVLLVGRE
ncbi:MAG TPA: hypothetical protein VF192_05165 [Longimicrobiales bacterium]